MARPRTKTSPLASGRPSRSTRYLLWGGLVYASLSLANLGVQEYRLLTKGHILRTELAATEEKARLLQEAITFAKTPAGIERIARKNLTMARPGEEAVRFVPPAEGNL